MFIAKKCVFNFYPLTNNHTILYDNSIRGVAPLSILIKGVAVKETTKKTLRKVCEELYRVVVEILIGVVLIIISEHV